MLDSETGLYYHGYNESGEQQWADPATGLSGEFWLRAMGWLCAGLADICELSDENGELFRFSRDMLTELLDSLSSCITDGDMLLQLPASIYHLFQELLFPAYVVMIYAYATVCG